MTAAKPAGTRSVPNRASRVGVPWIAACLLLLGSCQKVPIVDIQARFTLADLSWFAAEQTMFVFYELSAEQGIGPESQVGGFRDFTRGMVALYVGGMGARDRNFYNQLFQRYGYEAEAKQIQDLYLDGKKQEAAAAVPESFLEETSLCGDEGYVKDRIAQFKAAGVTVLNVTPIAPDLEGQQRMIAKVKELSA